MNDQTANAFESIASEVLRSVNPGELRLLSGNIAALKSGRGPVMQPVGGANTFGGAAGFVFILPAILAVLQDFAKASIEELGKSFGAHVVSVVKGDDHKPVGDVAVLGQAAMHLKHELQKRGLSAEVALRAADVMVVTFANHPELLRDLRRT